MNSESFKKFCDAQKLSSKPFSKSDVIGFFNRHKVELEVVVKATKVAYDFYEKTNPIAFLSGGLDVVKLLTVETNASASKFFSEKNGWVSVNKEFGYFPKLLICEILKDFEAEKIGGSEDYPYFVVKTPIGLIGMNEPGWWATIYYKKDETSAKKVIKFLMERKEKSILSPVIKFQQVFSGDKFETILEPIRFQNKSSCLSDKITNDLKFYGSVNSTRSIMFTGTPGSGKTTLAQSVISNLGYKTLIFDFAQFDRHTIFFLIKSMNIEAILINDIDQVGSDNKILDFLEEVREFVKVVFLTSNSMKTFHSAVIRPGRIDEIITVNELEENVVKEVLGHLSDEYFEKVKHFPVAYLKELVMRHSLSSKEEMEIHLTDLTTRVASQLKDCKS